jgi:hypothetical protein
MIGLVLILVGLNLWNDSAPINPTIRSSDNSGTQSSSLSRSFPLPYRNDTHEGNKGVSQDQWVQCKRIEKFSVLFVKILLWWCRMATKTSLLPAI